MTWYWEGMNVMIPEEKTYRIEFLHFLSFNFYIFIYFNYSKGLSWDVCVWCVSSSVVSDSLWSHGLQHARPLYPLPSPRAYSNSCPLSQWCHPTISSSVIPLLLLPSTFPSIRVFSNELALCIRWPKYWSIIFSISPSNEYSGLSSFRIDLFDHLAV